MDDLTPTERNALKWVLFLEWYEKYRNDPAFDALVKTRVEVLKQK